VTGESKKLLINSLLKQSKMMCINV